MRNLLKDENYNVVSMCCVDCRAEGKEWEDCVAVVMADQTTRCMEHLDAFLERNKNHG
jgi:hypothetical protein